MDFQHPLLILLNSYCLRQFRWFIAGGGGVDVGKGIGLQFNLSADYHFAKTSSLSFFSWEAEFYRWKLCAFQALTLILNKIYFFTANKTKENFRVAVLVY